MTFLLIIYTLSDLEEKNFSENNLNGSLTSDEEISGDEAFRENNTQRIISIQNGEGPVQNASSGSARFSQPSVFFAN